MIDVRRWRDETVAWLESSQNDRVSEELTEFLLWTLGAAPRPQYKIGPYVVTVFPEDAAEPDSDRAARRAQSATTSREVEHVLLWRAQVVDFLTDVWDTIGPSLFEMEECDAATALFMPAGEVPAEYCDYCLEPYADAAGRVEHEQVCPIRRFLVTYTELVNWFPSLTWDRSVICRLETGRWCRRKVPGRCPENGRR